MEQFGWFIIGVISTLFILMVIITVWVRTRGPFTVGPPEPPNERP